MLSVVTWLWGTKFSAAHVNILRSMLDRHLHMEHELHCFTNEPDGLDGDIIVHPITEFLDTPRCRRRMFQYSEQMLDLVGPRMLSLDLDVVLTDDVTPLFDIPDVPLALWNVGYANVYSGSVQLMRTGELHSLYEDFKAGAVTPKERNWSDQAALNWYLSWNWHRRNNFNDHLWGDGDGILTFFGKGYERYAHLGVSPSSERLPDGCRMVVMGSEDLKYLEMPLLREHYR